MRRNEKFGGLDYRVKDQSLPRVDTEGVGLVYDAPSGIVFTNQSGGYACLHPELEGVFVPYGNDSLQAALDARFAKDGHYYDGFDPEDADYLDASLAAFGLEVVTVNRALLDYCIEAWVPVTVRARPQGETWHRVFPAGGAILVWDNSD
jgi:hypothetical protein